MKISFNWLNDFVDLKDYKDRPQELANLLTDAGLEVEAVAELGKAFDHVVVGQVKVLDKHPNADRLTLCQVDIGSGELQQIVCGATNHKQGDKVVVALPGAVLPGDFKIKVSKIRDVESRGMLCSPKELGLSAESEGILILESDAKVGEAFSDKAPDIVFEVNVTPNRADCLSHIGLAREIACLLGRKLNITKSKIEKTKNSSNISSKKTVKLELKASDLCPRYAGRLVKNVKVGPSPQWLKGRLDSVGLNSINNIVDITNYVMMEFGQPLHAFDLKELHGSQITIAKSKGEKFTSLDGTEHMLTTDDLTIRDKDRVVALAGVVGGLNSGISDDTTDVFVESAHFTQDSVRKTARRLGIETDSAYRFSRGTDPENVVEAMNRACALMQELASGEVAEDFWDLYPKKQKRKPIKVRKDILEQRLGYPVKMSDFAKWMKRLQCEVRMNQNTCSVDVPAFRWDLDIEMDLVEEFARLNGYDKIPENFPVLESEPTDDSESFRTTQRLVSLGAELGYLQAINHHFIAQTWQDQIFDKNNWPKVGLNLGGPVVPVLNPLSEETGVMRQSLLPGLLQNLIYNCRQNQNYGRLFETGKVFAKGDAYIELERLAFVAWGHREDLWLKNTGSAVMDLKGVIEQLLQRLQGQGYQWRPIDKSSCPSILHPGQSACLFYQGKNIGFVGSIHPIFKEKHKIREDIALAELDVELLMKGQPRLPKLKKLSRFPSVDRDIALLVPKSLAAGDLVKEIQKQGGSQLQSVRIFDLYEGDGVPEDHSSIALRLRFQKPDGTYLEPEITSLMSQVMQALQKKYPVKQR